MSTTTTQKILEGLSRYRIRHKIGSGGMATVFLADDLVLKREVALKIMHEHLLSSSEAVRRFKSEARAVASLSHENIIRVFDYGEIETRPFLVMEYINGSTLVALIEQSGPLPNLVAVEVCRQVLSGLGAAHEKGVFHRDIKPDNIMIAVDGTVKIMDFGIAYVVNSESLTITGSFIGSPRFISPEQARGNPLAGTTDVFSLGVALYMCVTGTLPFTAEVPAAVIHAILHDTPDPACRKNSSVLCWVSEFIDTCMVKDPQHRPDARAALALLEKQLLFHGLTAGKPSLCAYVADAAACREFERKRLFEHYRQRSREAARNRQTASAIKALEQARVFGSLLPEDEKAVRRCHARRRIAVAAGIAAAVALGGGLAYVALTRTVGRMWSDDATASATAAVGVPAGTVVRGDLPPAPGDTTVPLIDTIDTIGVQRQVSPDSLSRDPPQHAAGPSITRAVSPPSPAWLSIRTNPPWARILIDDIERGTTPSKTEYAVGPGKHEIGIIKQGFEPYRSFFEPAPSETLQIRVQLVPSPAVNQ